MNIPIKRLSILLATAGSLNLHAAQVTTVIDPFTTSQQIVTNNTTATNTIAATSIGNYRTLVLGTPGASVVPTFFYVDDSTQTLSLDTPLGITPSFQIIWGGEGGTNGLGGVALGGGQPLDLLTSLLSFPLAATDQSSDFTWSFTDTATNTATYTGNFPAHSSTNPVLPFNIALDSFNNASGIDWNAIDFIVFSGGGTASLDMTLAAPIQLVASTVPEPGTWALLATGLGLTALVLRRKVRRCR
jgi:hypothetical protein